MRVINSGGFTVKLMKFKLWSPSLARTSSKAVRGALLMSYRCPKFFHLMYEKMLINIFPIFYSSKY